MSKPFARLATALPIWPRPTTARVLPSSRTPAYRGSHPGVHRASRTAWCLSRSFLAKPSTSAMACSATAIALAPRAFATRIPRRLSVANSSSSHPAWSHTNARSRSATSRMPGGRTQPIIASASRASGARSSWVVSKRDKWGRSAGAKTAVPAGSAARICPTSSSRAYQVRITFTARCAPARLGRGLERDLSELGWLQGQLLMAVLGDDVGILPKDMHVAEPESGLGADHHADLERGVILGVDAGRLREQHALTVAEAAAAQLLRAVDPGAEVLDGRESQPVELGAADAGAQRRRHPPRHLQHSRVGTLLGVRGLAQGRHARIVDRVHAHIRPGVHRKDVPRPEGPVVVELVLAPGQIELQVHERGAVSALFQDQPPHRPGDIAFRHAGVNVSVEEALARPR